MKQSIESAFLKLERLGKPKHWNYNCWVKPGASVRPLVRVEGKRYTAARVVLAYMGELDLNDPTALACHTCNNPLCFAPYHLYSGTKSTNAKDYERTLRGVH